MDKVWQDFMARGGKRNLFSLIKNTILVPGLRAVIFYRISNYFNRKGMTNFSLLIFNLNHMLHGCEIKPNARIGGGLVLPHAVGIVIGEGVIIGDNCLIYHNVTLGTDNPNNPRYPIIGNKVHLYVGSTVLGMTTIGDNSRIGAHSLVLNDVPKGSLAVGIPAKIKVG